MEDAEDPHHPRSRVDPHRRQIHGLRVDPVGTGYSRATGKEDDAEKRFWGVKSDVSSLSEIVRLWLTKNGRWASPKFLAGESYGGFRAVMMARTISATSTELASDSTRTKMPSISSLR